MLKGVARKNTKMAKRINPTMADLALSIISEAIREEERKNRRERDNRRAMKYSIGTGDNW